MANKNVPGVSRKASKIGGDLKEDYNNKAPFNESQPGLPGQKELDKELEDRY